MTLSQKLNPNRFTAMSGLMSAIVGCLVGEEFSDPRLVALQLTPDDMLQGSNEEDGGLMNQFLGSGEDFRRNLGNLVVAAELNQKEKRELKALVLSHVGRRGLPGELK
jgi:hypothetical protein